jgi:hypothetical protein
MISDLCLDLDGVDPVKQSSALKDIFVLKMKWMHVDDFFEFFKFELERNARLCSPVFFL